MTKAYVKYVVTFAAAGLIVFLSCLSFAAGRNLMSWQKRAMFYLEQPISNQNADNTRQEIEKSWEEYQQNAAKEGYAQEDAGQEGAGQEDGKVDMTPEFCIWGQKDMVFVSNQDLGRNVQGCAILLCGNPELVFEDCRKLDREDYEGCLVDEEMAWELFGSVDVEGEKVTCEGKDYTIRGVVPGNKKLFAFAVDGRQPKQQTETGTAMETPENVLNRITLQMPEGKTVQELHSEWNNSYNMSARLMDLELLQGVGGFCMLLVPVSLCACLLWYLYRRFRKQEHPFWKVGIAVLAVLLLALFGMFLKNWIQIPDEYIPTRWSDFSFWSELWNEKKEAAQLLRQMPKTVMDTGWMESFTEVVGYGILSEVLAVLLIPVCAMLYRRIIK